MAPTRQDFHMRLVCKLCSAAKYYTYSFNIKIIKDRTGQKQTFWSNMEQSEMIWVLKCHSYQLGIRRNWCTFPAAMVVNLLASGPGSYVFALPHFLQPTVWSNKFRRICESLVNHLQIICQSQSLCIPISPSRHVNRTEHRGTRTFFADGIASQLLLPPEPGLYDLNECANWHRWKTDLSTSHSKL
jgi:hypothetical protein